MTNLLKIYSVLLMIIFISSCETDPLPIVIDEDPVFVLKGQINGEEINISAGLDDYGMITSTSKDSLGINEFSGQYLSTSTQESITIRLRDRKIMEDENNFIENLSFITGELPIATFAAPHFLEQTYIFRHANIDIAMASDFEFLWIFNDVDSTTVKEPVFYFPNVADQKVSLTITDPSTSCTESWEEILKFALEPPCIFSTFIYKNNTNGFVNFASPLSEGWIVNSTWDFGDNTTVDLFNTSITSHLYETPGTYEVCLDVNLLGGCTDSYCSEIQSHENVGCAAGFDYVPSQLSPMPYYFSSVVVDYVSKEGKAYSSFVESFVVQPVDSYFEILETDDFINNIDGFMTKKLTSNTRIILYNINDSNDQLLFETDEMIFGVAYTE